MQSKAKDVTTYNPYVRVAGMLVLLLCWAAGSPAQAALAPGAPQPGPDYTVNDPADPGNAICAVESCSLRAAIVAAHTDGLPGLHHIDFDLTYPVTITLSSALPVINGNLAIQGPGAADLAIAGNGFRVLEVGPGAAIDLGRVTIRRGYHDFRGGGLFNDGGALRIWNSIFTDNQSSGEGGALNNDGGTVVISDTLFIENDSFHHGAVTNSGTMTLSGVYFKDNFARFAGAVNNSGTMTVTQSTFSGNGARFSGGALVNGGALVVANSTFYTNRAGDMGGGIQNGGSLEITNSTFYSNTAFIGGNIAGGGTTRLRNTILAAGNEGGNCDAPGGTLTADASNLATDATCDAATVKTPAELALGTLQDSVQPAPAIPLLYGSAAIDAGVDAVCAAPVGAPAYGAGGVDQRGVTRPVGAHCDVGAYEWNPTLWLFFPLIFGH